MQSFARRRPAVFLVLAAGAGLVAGRLTRGLKDSAAGNPTATAAPATTDRGWAALIVAAIWLVVAAVLGLIGRREISAVPGVPQTAETAKEIPNAVRGNEGTS